MLNGAFCSAKSKSVYLEMNEGTVPFQIISGEQNHLRILLTAPHPIFGWLFSKKTFVFLSTKETFHTVRQQAGVS